MRLFVALELDLALRRALAQAASGLTLHGGRVRWVPEERLHLTLRFLGEVTASGIDDVTDAVRDATQEMNGFRLHVRGLGCFPPQPRTPRVLWAGIRPEPRLGALVDGVEEGLRRRGFPPERRRFAAHVTLARCQGKVQVGSPLDRETPDFGEQEVEAVTVMESALTPQGPRYEAVAVLPLGGAAE